MDILHTGTTWVCQLPSIQEIHMNKNRTATLLLLSVILLGAGGCASTPTSSSAGEVIDDTVITTRVKAAIFGDEDLSVMEINVETFKGEVQLSGFVSTQAEITKAGALARTIPGVATVRNDIRIK
jgi:osmotically-inducible protein OsmY